MEKMSELTKATPLLYITQPFLVTPKAKMQHFFMYKESPEPICLPADPEKLEEVGEEKSQKQTEKKTSTKEEEALENHKVVPNKELETQEVRHEQQNLLDESKGNPLEIMSKEYLDTLIGKNVMTGWQEETIETTERANENSSKERVPFNDLPLEEKYKYLLAVPMTTAKIRFEFITTNGNYQGYFLSNKEDIVEIMSMSKKETVKVPIHFLKDIKMIGI
ncbi:MAG TPA: CotO family spore coat protein [Bacillales bacterium]|nr:CotO family spore coat protein [Bacillales bacterium]